MGLEVATFLNELVSTNPTGTDDYSTADDHLRLIKSVLQSTFPNINAAVNADPTEMNVLDGLLATTAELNVLDGFTGVLADLQIIAGAAAGGVTAAEFAFLDGVSSAIQTQLAARELTANKGVANGYASLDSSADVPDAQIPFLNASKINAGTFAVARGGTGIGTYVAGNYINALSASALQQRTPAQVRTDLNVVQPSVTNNWTARQDFEVGIQVGTASPVASIGDILVTSVTTNASSVPAETTNNLSLVVAGAISTSKVFISPRTQMEDGLSVYGGASVTANRVLMYLVNATGAAIDPANRTYDILAINAT